MKGQLRATIPALIGIAPLLLAGIMGFWHTPGAEQVTEIAETRAVTYDARHRENLANALRRDAEAAADALGADFAADLALELGQTEPSRVARMAAASTERG